MFFPRNVSKFDVGVNKATIHKDTPMKVISTPNWRMFILKYVASDSRSGKRKYIKPTRKKKIRNGITT